MKISHGWKTDCLGNLCKRVTVGIATSVSEHYRQSGVPIFRNQNILPGKLDDSDLLFISEEFALRNSAKAIKPRDVVTVRTGNVGISAVVPAKYDSAQTFTTLITTTKHDELLPEFLCQHLNSRLGEIQFRQLTGDSGRGNLNAGEFVNYTLDVPPVNEQKIIAEILALWDGATMKLEFLKSAEAERKRGLAQQLLTGQTRFKEFSAERWHKLELGDVVTYEPRTVAKPEGAFLAAGIRSHGKGVFLKPDFDADDIALDELFVLRTDDLVVSITFGWEGAAAIVPPEADGALVSHRFPTFTFKPGVSFPGYFRHVIKQKRFVYEMGLASPGGAGRNRVLSKTEFLRIPVVLPPRVEQERIAEVLNDCDREIELMEKQLAALKEQKRGLMQKLLSGEVRVMS